MIKKIEKIFLKKKIKRQNLEILLLKENNKVIINVIIELVSLIMKNKIKIPENLLRKIKRCL